ncbi:MAG: thioredoxin domain-containing protein, partial [Magnetovibrio sp.]|nr:thioredoxin domain-containing protein [Magnetovibrio sp.]
ANMPTLINAFELLSQGTQVVISGPPKEAAALIRVTQRAPGNLRVLIRNNGEADVAPDHPRYGKTMVDGKPAAYVCHAGTCAEPVVDADVLIKVLGAL